VENPVVPQVVELLARERQAAREARDFAAADELRAQLEARGWNVVDTPAGPTLQPRPVARASATVLEVHPRAEDVPSLWSEPAAPGVTLILPASRWRDDLVRCAAAFSRNSPSLQILVVASTAEDERPAVEWLESQHPNIWGLLLEEVPGHAMRLNAGLRRARTEFVAIADTSVEPAGDCITPLVTSLADASLGAAGPFGLRSRDLREFEDDPGPEVDALEGYLMVMRRDVMARLGGLDHHYRFYRIADIDLSLAIRAAGYALRAVAGLPMVRHMHRGWHETPEDERERLSKRNFYRFLKRFGDRYDLLIDPDPASHHHHAHH
jgi:cysteinyl-tRNA synthetase